MQCLGQVVGLSRERVRQIIKEQKLPYRSKKGPNPIVLTWPCPQCGKPAKSKTGFVVDRRATVLCNDCVHGQGEFCKKGHLNPPRYKNGCCKLCIRAKQNRIVEGRPCVVCGKLRNISYGHRSIAKINNLPNTRCRNCYYNRGKEKDNVGQIG